MAGLSEEQEQRVTVPIAPGVEVVVMDKPTFLAMVRGEIDEPEWWSYAAGDLTPDEQREAATWQARREDERG